MKEGSRSREGPRIRAGFLDAERFGRRVIAWTSSGLCRLWWSVQETPAQLLPPEPVPSGFSEPLHSYFAGEEVDPTSLPVDLRGTAFQLQVWHELRRIRRGQVRTYAAVASRIGSPRATRAVGAANAANPLPIVVPCHRVVAAGFCLGGYSAGLDRKRRLLELEGVRVVQERVRPGQLQLL